MSALLLIAGGVALWCAVLVLGFVLCRAAALGDEAEHATEIDSSARQGRVADRHAR